MVSHNHIKGFTLIETLVAISILLITVLGPMSLFSKSIMDARFAQEQITAFYLAQEGLELVINKNSSNARNGEDFLEGLVACKSPSSCQVSMNDSLGIVVGRCSGGCENLKIDNDNIYGYDNSGTETSFIRKITIDELVSGQEAKITSEVIWRDGERTTAVSSYIFNIP